MSFSHSLDPSRPFAAAQYISPESEDKPTLAMLEGEDARVVAKQLLREKTVPESESFNRPIRYPKLGLA